MATLTDSDSGLTAHPLEPGSPRWRRSALLAAALAGAWLLPVVTHTLGTDWLLLIVIWLGVASLVHAGRILLDRLVFAAVLLAGYLIVGGLVFSVWPWGLQPVPIGGLTLSVLVLTAAITGRRPSLPARVIPSDALVLGSGALSWHYLSAPTAGRSFIQRLPFIAAREDMFNHFTIFDMIHRIGAYPFLDQAATHPYTSDTLQNPSALRLYPAGMHYLDALFDIFLRSTTDPGASIAEYDRFVNYSMANVAILAAVIVWAARWIAGPALAGWRRGFAMTVVGGLAAAGQLSTLYWQGFNAQAAGLVVLAAAAAVTARPPRRVREQILLIAALVVTSTFVYNLTALMVIGMAGINVVIYWRRLLRHWRFALLIGVPAVAIALIPYVAQALLGISADSKFLSWGTSIRFSRTLSVVFALSALTAMLSRNGRRSPVWRVVALSVTACCALTVAMGYYAYTQLGVTNYYYEKLVEGAWVVSLTGFGAVGFLFRSGFQLSAVRHPRRLAITNAATACLAGAVAAVMAGVIPLTSTRFPDWRPKQDVTWASVWAQGFITSGFSDPIERAAQHGLIGDDRATIILYSDSGHDNRSATMFVSALNHDRGLVTDYAIDMIARSDGLATLKLPSKGHPMSAKDSASLANLVDLVNHSKVPLRIILWNRDVYDYLKNYSGAHPGLQLTVVQLVS